MTERFSTKELALSVLFAAPACVATMSIHIPTPGAGGYIRPGNIIVVLYGVLLDPVSAFLVAGVGSCMADLLGGYFICVPTTFAIRGLVAFLTSHVCRSLRARGVNPYAVVAGCSVINIVLVAGGHCMCEVFLYGLNAALTSIPSNIIQEIGGLITSSALYSVLQKPLFIALRTQRVRESIAKHP